jgi:hypothetical protein
MGYSALSNIQSKEYHPLLSGVHPLLSVMNSL